MDDVLCNLQATVAASSKSATAKLERVGAKKRFVELAAPLLGKRRRMETTSYAATVLNEEAAKKDSVSSRNLNGVDIAYYQNMIDLCNKEDQKHKEAAAKSVESVREVRRVFLYGLQKVSKLQDITSAPDALMPGNFVGDSKQQAAEEDEANTM